MAGQASVEQISDFVDAMVAAVRMSGLGLHWWFSMELSSMRKRSPLSHQPAGIDGQPDLIYSTDNDLENK